MISRIFHTAAVASFTLISLVSEASAGEFTDRFIARCGELGYQNGAALAAALPRLWAPLQGTPCDSTPKMTKHAVFGSEGQRILESLRAHTVIKSLYNELNDIEFYAFLSGVACEQNPPPPALIEPGRAQEIFKDLLHQLGLGAQYLEAAKQILSVGKSFKNPCAADAVKVETLLLATLPDQGAGKEVLQVMVRHYGSEYTYQLVRQMCCDLATPAAPFCP